MIARVHNSKIPILYLFLHHFHFCTSILGHFQLRLLMTSKPSNFLKRPFSVGYDKKTIFPDRIFMAKNRYIQKFSIRLMTTKQKKSGSSNSQNFSWSSISFAKVSFGLLLVFWWSFHLAFGYTFFEKRIQFPISKVPSNIVKAYPNYSPTLEVTDKNGWKNYHHAISQ